MRNEDPADALTGAVTAGQAFEGAVLEQGKLLLGPDQAVDVFGTAWSVTSPAAARRTGSVDDGAPEGYVPGN